MEFFVSDALKTRLGRVKSPIAEAILNLKEVDGEDKQIVNYLGISTDNCSLISYMDKGKIDRYKNEVKETQEIDYDKPFIVKMDGRVTPGTFDLEFAKGNCRYEQLGEWDGKFYRENVTPTIYERDKDRTAAGYDGTVIYVGWKVPNHPHLSVSERDTYIWNCWVPDEHYKYIKGLEPQYKTITEQAVWDANLRTKAAAAKTVRRLFGEKFTSDEYEAFSCMYKMEAMKECGTDSKYLYEEVKEARIKWAYSEDNYYRSNYQLGDSCKFAA